VCAPPKSAPNASTREASQRRKWCSRGYRERVPLGARLGAPKNRAPHLKAGNWETMQTDRSPTYGAGGERHVTGGGIQSPHEVRPEKAKQQESLDQMGGGERPRTLRSGVAHSPPGKARPEKKKKGEHTGWPKAGTGTPASLRGLSGSRKDRVKDEGTECSSGRRCQGHPKPPGDRKRTRTRQPGLGQRSLASSVRRV